MTQGTVNASRYPGFTRAWIAPVVLAQAVGAGCSKAEALRAAMSATRVKYPNPVNRAAFVLLGEPD